MVYMRDRNFIWDPGTFKILGIVFSTNLSEMVALNFEDKIGELKRDISKWKRKHLTPLGKITYKKTFCFEADLSVLEFTRPIP